MSTLRLLSQNPARRISTVASLSSFHSWKCLLVATALVILNIVGLVDDIRAGFGMAYFSRSIYPIEMSV